MNITKKKITGIGANVYDTLITLSEFPIEDTKIRADGIRVAGGGPCATAIVAASKLGASTSYIGNMANDEKGKFLISDFERFGVSTEYINIEEDCSSFSSYVFLSRETASRTIVFHKGDLPPLKLNLDQKEEIKRADILIIDGNEMDAAIQACKLAKENKTKILYDAGGLYLGVENLISYADILIPSEEFALKFTNMDNAEDAIEKLYDMYRPEIVVITQGNRGGIMYDGSLIKAYPVFNIKVVDSNGAGDVFHGAFAFAVTQSWDYYKCCVFSSAVASLKCTKIGSRDSSPTYEETIKFLSSNGNNEF